MSFDLALWAGPRPVDGAAALATYERLTAWFDDDDYVPDPPTPVITAFLADLLARYPGLGEPGDQDSPWAAGPEPGDTDGDFVYLTMTYSGARSAYETVVGLAHRHGLVCYDPQAEALV